MASDYVQVNFRMPIALKNQLEHEAKANGRSLTAEIAFRLETTLSKPRTLADLAKYIAPSQPPYDPLDGIRSDIQELSKQIEALRRSRR